MQGRGSRGPGLRTTDIGQWFPTLVLRAPCPACLRCFLAPTHPIQMKGSSWGPGLGTTDIGNPSLPLLCGLVCLFLFWWRVSWCSWRAPPSSRALWPGCPPSPGPPSSWTGALGGSGAGPRRSIWSPHGEADSRQILLGHIFDYYLLTSSFWETTILWVWENGCYALIAKVASPPMWA